MQKNNSNPALRAKRQARRETFFRRLKWIFSKSGMMSLAFEHFLAMVPSTILVPLLINNSLGATVIDVSLVLFSSGLGTILFTILSRGKIPAYLGSSFAYIGLTIYLIEEQTAPGGVDPSLAYAYVGWAYLFSGILLIALSFLYQKKGIEKILSFLLPASIVGPAISLIGLELADTAIVDSGFDVVEGMVDPHAALVSIVTLVVIVLFSLIRHKIWKNSAIILGMLAGYLVYLCLNGLPDIQAENIRYFTVPDFHIPLFALPKNLLGLFLAVVPATFILFTENIGRVTVISRMVNDESNEEGLFSSKSVGTFQKALLSHGVASAAASLIGSVPNTIYAENIAVMGIHKSDLQKEDPDPVIQGLLNPCSPVPYLLAAGLAILFSFVGILQTILLGIPKPVIGGMELFLFGIISAPGIQLLVDQRVDYKKVSNQIITAAVLISGISGLSVNLGSVELKGMGLGFVVGVLLNLLVQALKWLGNISDSVTFEEVLINCLGAIGKESRLSIRTPDLASFHESLQQPDNLYRLLHNNESFRKDSGGLITADFVRSTIAQSAHISFAYPNDPCAFLTLKETANGIVLELPLHALDEVTVKKYLNDYEEAFDRDEALLLIWVSRNIPFRKVQRLLKIATARMETESK